MRGGGQLRWVGMAAAALLLASILAFLYSRTREHDPAIYFGNVALLRQLKQLDSRWELDVLKSRMGINSNYDSLVNPLAELDQLRQELHAVVTAEPHAADPQMTAALDAFRQAIEQKTQLIERFKSQNSVLRNSLVFLPTAADELQRALRAPGTRDAQDARVSADVTNEVLLDGMVFSQATSAEKAAEIEAGLSRLEARRKALPAAATEALEIFAAHVRTVLREQPVVNGLLENIVAVPVAAAIDRIDMLLSDEQRRSTSGAVQFRRYLLIFATALAALLLYAALNVVRSHAEINRVNRELQGANSTLEQRVLERTSQLREAQDELVGTARRAGMAEIANNVLHNVGNVLNSVNVSAGVVAGLLRDSKAQWVGRSAQLLKDNAGDLGNFLTRDERGKALPGYLDKLAVALATEQEQMARELASLTRSIDHIKEIVATQQSYAGASSVVESVQIPELLEDALRINATELTRRQVTTVKEGAMPPPLLLDKHLILQILVNLVRNAGQAMSADRPHRMTLRTEMAGPDEGRRLRIQVQDDGDGIAPENLPQLFAHGFTTRKGGHGFGLHSCALAAKQMGGMLSAHSDGPGRGAIFTLELPARIEAVS